VAYMSGTHSSLLALLVATAACGSVPMEDEDIDAPAASSTTYQATMAMSAPPVAFGGTAAFVCKYTMTLKQIQISLTKSPAGLIVGGSVQNGTEEKVTNPGTGATDCPYAPAGPTTQKFTFKSATPVGASTMVVMEGDATNAPKASLAITLTPTAGSYTASARWTRTDQVPDLTWSVTTSMTMTVK
jgi:hypothetical protein